MDKDGMARGTRVAMQANRGWRGARWALIVLCVWLAACSSGKDAATSAQADAGTKPAALDTHDDPASRVDWTAMQAFWTQAMQLPGIDTGPADSNKRILVIFDPDCPVCARQWRVLQPYLDRVRIHWVPVAYINGASLHRAAAILSAADPASALARNEQGFDFRRQQGGQAIPSDISAQALDTVRANTRTLMRDAGVIATPTLGFELYPHKRYYRMLGMLDAAGMKRAVDTLGHTMDPWHAESTTAEQHSP